MGTYCCGPGTSYIDQAGLEHKGSAYLCFSSAGIKGEPSDTSPALLFLLYTSPHTYTSLALPGPFGDVLPARSAVEHTNFGSSRSAIIP